MCGGKVGFAAFAASVGAAFQHGFHIGFVNIPFEVYLTWYQNLHKQRKADGKLDILTLWSATIASFAIGGFLGGMLVAIFSNIFGRKKALLCSNCIVLLSVIMLCLSRYSESYELFIVGRFLIGVHAGLNSGICPIYLIEIATDEVRGLVGSTYGVVVAVATFFAQLLTMPSVLGTDSLWPAAIAVAIAPTVLQAIFLLFCPESPKYLYINKEDEDGAEEALEWFRDTWDIDDELDDLREETLTLNEIDDVTFLRFFTDETIRTPLIICTVMMVGHQVCGVNAVFFFSHSILQKLKLNSSTAIGLTLALGAVNVICTIISIFLVDILGRKTLILMSFGGMTVATLCLTITLVYIEKEPDQTVTVGYAAISFMFLLVLFFAFGAGTIPWFITPEISNHNARPLATCIVVTVGWLMNFLASMTGDIIYRDLGYFVFGFYFFGNLTTLIFLAVTMRETMKESALDIMEMFYD